MTNTEYQDWLATLTTGQRAAVEIAVGVMMNMLLGLDGRVAACEDTHRKMGKRLDRIERYLCFPESTE
jgi:hypothetical protein